MDGEVPADQMAVGENLPEIDERQRLMEIAIRKKNELVTLARRLLEMKQKARDMVAKKDLVVGKHNALIAMVRDMSTDMELYQKEVEIAERKSPPKLSPEDELMKQKLAVLIEQYEVHRRANEELEEKIAKNEAEVRKLSEEMADGETIRRNLEVVQLSLADLNKSARNSVQVKQEPQDPLEEKMEASGASNSRRKMSKSAKKAKNSKKPKKSPEVTSQDSSDEYKSECLARFLSRDLSIGKRNTVTSTKPSSSDDSSE